MIHLYTSAQKLKTVFTDIDGTLTREGQLPAESFEALWRLHQSGINIVPVTGRPAGWCEMMARLWPISGIVGENGAFYFAYKNKKMHRAFVHDEPTRKKNMQKLFEIFLKIKEQIPRCDISSDQFCRLTDLAVDFCEDISAPLSLDEARKIQKLFEQNGATAKVSSIHVNGWFGDYDKRKMCEQFAVEILKTDLAKNQNENIFVGDSPNDEPLFEFFENSFAVANIKPFLDELQHKPKFIAQKTEGDGFVEIINFILKSRSTF